MALGAAPLTTQVTQAMCFDYFHVSGTNPITITIGTLAAAYYGWDAADRNAVQTWMSQRDCPGAPGYPSG